MIYLMIVFIKCRQFASIVFVKCWQFASSIKDLIIGALAPTLTLIIIGSAWAIGFGLLRLLWPLISKLIMFIAVLKFLWWLWREIIEPAARASYELFKEKSCIIAVLGIILSLILPDEWWSMVIPKFVKLKSIIGAIIFTVIYLFIMKLFKLIAPAHPFNKELASEIKPISRQIQSDDQQSKTDDAFKEEKPEEKGPELANLEHNGEQDPEIN